MSKLWSKNQILNISSLFSQGKPLYMLLYASGIIFFCFFYTSIVFNPRETAENLRKYVAIYRTIFSLDYEKTSNYSEIVLFFLRKCLSYVQILSLFLQKPRNTKQNTKCPVLLIEY